MSAVDAAVMAVISPMTVMRLRKLTTACTVKTIARAKQPRAMARFTGPRLQVTGHPADHRGDATDMVRLSTVYVRRI